MDQQQDQQVTKFWNEKISKTTTYAHTHMHTHTHIHKHKHVHTYMHPTLAAMYPGVQTKMSIISYDLLLFKVVFKTWLIF